MYHLTANSSNLRCSNIGIRLDSNVQLESHYHVGPTSHTFLDLRMGAYEALVASALPSIATAMFATLGYAATMRIRRGNFPSSRIVCKQLGYSLVGCFAISSIMFESRQNARTALVRMMRVAETSIEIDFRDQDSHAIRATEYDEATGVDAEKITYALMKSMRQDNSKKA